MSGSLTGNYGEFPGAGNKNAGEEILNIVEGTGSHRRWFKGPWDTRYDFIEDELLVNGGSFPARHPHNPLLFVHVIRIKGTGESSWDSVNKATNWERALITVEYRTFDSSTGGDDPDTNTPADYTKQKFVEESSDSNLELITLPGQAVEVNGQRQHMNGPFHAPSVTETIMIKIPRYLNPPWFAYNYLAGRLNDTCFITPSGRCFERGTLRFDGFSTDTKINLNFNLAGTDEEEIIAPFYSLTLKFEYNWHRWDQKFIDGQWQTIGRFDNDAPFLEFDDLYTLFFGYDTNNRFDSDTLEGMSNTLTAIRQAMELTTAVNGKLEDVLESFRVIQNQAISLGFNLEPIP